MQFLLPLLAFSCVFDPNNITQSITRSYDTQNNVANGRIQHFVSDPNGRLLGSITYFISTGQIYSMYIDLIIQNKQDIENYLLDIAYTDLRCHNVNQMWEIEYKCFVLFCFCGKHQKIDIYGWNRKPNQSGDTTFYSEYRRRK